MVAKVKNIAEKIPPSWIPWLPSECALNNDAGCAGSNSSRPRPRFHQRCHLQGLQHGLCRPQTCGGGGEPGVCGSPTCTPTCTPLLLQRWVRWYHLSMRRFQPLHRGQLRSRRVSACSDRSALRSTREPDGDCQEIPFIDACKPWICDLEDGICHQHAIPGCVPCEVDGDCPVDPDACTVTSCIDNVCHQDPISCGPLVQEAGPACPMAPAP